MRGRAERERLDERDPERESRLRIGRKRLLGRAVDQDVKIGQPAQRLGSDRVGKGSIISPLQIPRRRVERRFEGQPFPEHRVEQAERGPARGGSDRIIHAAHLALAPSTPDLWFTPAPDANGTAMAGKRPEHVKPPNHLSKSPPVPVPEQGKPAEEHGGPKGREPTRYGDWENKGIAWDF